MARERLDLALVKQGLAPSREQAKRLIMAGEVSVTGRRVTQPGWLLKESDQIVVRTPPKFVSRGGLKLEGALEHFGIDVTGMTALDAGASTGGFTDCLLQRGAVKVFAFDVGTNQLVWKLRSDPRVVSREQFNLRYMVPEDLGQLVDVVVADLSFISLTLVLPAILKALRPGGHAVVLIKPQFELSREEVGKGGIIREPELHAKACQRIEDFVRSQEGLYWRGVTDSPIQGTDGNREFLAWIRTAEPVLQ
jgi:23S rRNA (cytidine1920-2'-O)/16S rRNA (cytidine1409-2'-O)-methyltransferase